MATNMNAEFNGLGTFSVTADVAGPYFIEGKLSLPTITAGGGQSAVVVTINKNGTPFYTGLAGATGFYTDVNLVAGDVVNVVFSSSTAPDQPLNVIKTQIAIGMGQ